jgi:hypothetical protein
VNESELRNLLPPERTLPADRSRALEERLMTLIHDKGADEPGGTPDGDVIALEGAPSRRRRHRRLVAVAAVAIVAGVAVGGAFARRDPDPTVTDETAGSDTAHADPATDPGALPTVVIGATPDPAHVARVAEVFRARSSVHTPGWRWGLRAEDVHCNFPDGSAMQTSASEFPMEQALTAEHFVQECSQGNDAARMVGGFDGTGAQVCVGGGDDPAAAVTLDGRSCEAVDPGLRPMTDADLAQLNRMRAVEAALLAAPQDCSSEEQSVAWAEHVVAAGDLGLDVEITPQMPDGSPAPPGMTPPASMEIPVPLPPGEVPEPGEMVPTTIVTADEAPPVCFIARVDWTRPVVEIQGGWN